MSERHEPAPDPRRCRVDAGVQVPVWEPEAERASLLVAARDAAIEQHLWASAARYAGEARDAIASALAAGASMDELAAELDYPGGAAELDGDHIDRLINHHYHPHPAAPDTPAHDTTGPDADADADADVDVDVGETAVGGAEADTSVGGPSGGDHSVGDRAGVAAAEAGGDAVARARQAVTTATAVAAQPLTDQPDTGRAAATYDVAVDVDPAAAAPGYGQDQDDADDVNDAGQGWSR
jgi:hypothetical protein